MRRYFTDIYQIADDKVSIEDMDGATAQALKRKAIQLPSLISGVGFLIWIMAGFIFGLIQPVVTQIIYGIEADLIECLKQFFGITCIGGSITTLFIYFSIEMHWREAIPKFFPEGDLSHVKDAFKLRVYDRLLIVFIAISSVPLPLLGIAAYNKAQALHKADGNCKDPTAFIFISGNYCYHSHLCGCLYCIINLCFKECFHTPGQP